MPQINGVVTDDGTTQTTTYTGTATNKIQTFFFSNKQNGFILTNNGTAILTLKVSGRSYIINAEESVSISQECSSFNIVRSGVGNSEFSLTAYLFHSGVGEVPNVPKPDFLIEDTLTSTNTKSALSANQGRVLNEQVVNNSNKLNDLGVNVKDFGAKGDGVTDDTTSIQSAINTGKNVFFPPGTYRITMNGKTEGQFALNSYGLNQIIKGSGIGKTILKLDGTASVSLQVLGMDNGKLCDMSIDGGFDPASKQANLSSCVQTNSNTIVESCNIYNTQGSCLVSVGQNVIWRGNRLEKFGDHAMYIAGNLDGSGNILQTAKKIILDGNICTEDSTYQNGVLGGTDRGVIKIRDNVLEASITGNVVSGDMGVLIEGNYQFANGIPKNITVSGNTFSTTYTGVMVDTHGTTDNGFRIENVTISSNTVDGVSKAGNGVILKLAKADISGNTFINVNTGVTNQDVGDNGASIISGNTFRNALTGIYKAGMYTNITGNIFDNCTTQGIFDQFKNIIKGNVFKSCLVGLVISTSSSSDYAEYSNNMFNANTTGALFKDTSNSYTFYSNMFTNNTTSVTVENGNRFNQNLNYNNQILSGTAFPSSGTIDGIAIVPSLPVFRQIASLPTASATYRGKIIRVDGGTGVADNLYMCMKSSTDTYSWKVITTG